MLTVSEVCAIMCVSGLWGCFRTYLSVPFDVFWSCFA